MRADITDNISGRHDQLLWCDLETTGSDPEECSILEGAFVLTTGPDTGFEVLAELTEFFEIPDPCSWETDALQMHTRSGLIDFHTDAGRRIYPSHQTEVGGILFRFVRDALESCNELTLAGRNLHRTRAFLEEHMPEIEKMLNDRHFNVETVEAVDPGLRVDEDQIEGTPNRAKFDIQCDLQKARLFVRGGWKQTSLDEVTSVEGINTHRLEREPLEKKFAEKWAEIGPSTLPYVLSDDNSRASLSERDYEVAATIIQWLGSPVGSNFVRQVMETDE